MTHPPHWLQVVAVAAAVNSGMACSGRSGAGASEPAPAQPASVDTAVPDPAALDPSGPARWLAVDSAGRTVTLKLEVTAPPGAPSALINGFRAGAARVVVPLGWTVKWNWVSADSAAPHSLVVMVQREKIPLEGGRAFFSNAMTRMVTEGLRPGQPDQTSFTADEAGWYWLLCGVPGHALNGEWLELRVDPEAATAAVQVKKREQ
jgi:hypothetical protein